LHRTRIALPGFIIGKRKTASALDADEQAVGGNGGSAKNEAAAG
jgi:hypothetical protein